MKVGSPLGKGEYHITAEINMIPLIDVALVLLIIFMVISPILVQSQMRVNVPKVTSAGSAEENAIKIEIASDGTVAFEGKIVPKENLRVLMESSRAPGSQRALLIQADKDVAFDHVVYVMDIAKQLRFEKLGVSVVPKVAN